MPFFSAQTLAVRVLISKTERAVLLCPPAHLPRSIQMTVVLALNSSLLAAGWGGRQIWGKRDLSPSLGTHSWPQVNCLKTEDQLPSCC